MYRSAVILIAVGLTALGSTVGYAVFRSSGAPIVRGDDSTISPGASTAAAPGTVPAPATAGPPPPTPPVPFEEAFTKAANAVFSNARLPEGQKFGLVIDPLVDGVSGAQSLTTQDIGRRLVDLAQRSYSGRFEVLPFSSASLAAQPLLLIGTFTAITHPSKPQDAPKDSYRICLTMIDLKTGKVVSKGRQFTPLDGIDTTPTAFFQESPVFTKDEASEGYVKTCQTTWFGDSAQQAYIDRIVTAAMVSDGVKAFDEKRYADALDAFTKAAAAPGGNQLRVLNGIYLSQLKLNHRNEAAEAFGKAVDYGLANNKLSVKFLFRVGSRLFLNDTNANTAYPIWLKQIAERASQRNACLEVVGHTTRTGTVALNEKLSLLRAQYVKDRIQTQAASLSKRLTATGVGPRENLIGTGKDNASDALDRRVEFKVGDKCG